MSETVQGIADLVGGSVIGYSHFEITGVAGVDGAETGDLVFADSPQFLEAALKCKASVIIVTPENVQETSKTLIVVDNPRSAFVQVLEKFAPPMIARLGVDSSAKIGENVILGTGVSIAHNVTVGKGAEIGDGAILMPGVSIGECCQIGAGSVLFPNVVVYPGVSIGRNCRLHAGCVIGADGFGYIPIGYQLKKIPHLGTVVIGDEVEIGANACIDRAKTGKTVIGSGTKIDNLVHIAHNVQIGMSCLLVAQAGIAGSSVLGNGVVLAGQAGIKDHIRLGDGARVGAQGGVIGDVAPGVTVSGYPARPHGEKMREHAALSALPEYLKRIRTLEKKLLELESKVTGEQ